MITAWCLQVTTRRTAVCHVHNTAPRVTVLVKTASVSVRPVCLVLRVIYRVLMTLGVLAVCTSATVMVLTVLAATHRYVWPTGTTSLNHHYHHHYPRVFIRTKAAIKNHLKTKSTQKKHTHTHTQKEHKKLNTRNTTKSKSLQTFCSVPIHVRFVDNWVVHWAL